MPISPIPLSAGGTLPPSARLVSGQGLAEEELPGPGGSRVEARRSTARTVATVPVRLRCGLSVSSECLAGRALDRDPGAASRGGELTSNYPSAAIYIRGPHRVFESAADCPWRERLSEARNTRMSNRKIAGSRVTCLEDERNIAGIKRVGDQETAPPPQIDVDDRAVEVRRRDDVERFVDGTHRSDNLSPRLGDLRREADSGKRLVLDDQDAFAGERHADHIPREMSYNTLESRSPQSRGPMINCKESK
jgi:hypothetical protein